MRELMLAFNYLDKKLHEQNSIGSDKVEPRNLGQASNNTILFLVIHQIKFSTNDFMIVMETEDCFLL